MTRPALIAGDWGTSNLRLWLCNADGTALARRAGPGAASVDTPFAHLLQSLVADWRSAHEQWAAVSDGEAAALAGLVQIHLATSHEQVAHEA